MGRILCGIVTWEKKTPVSWDRLYICPQEDLLSYVFAYFCFLSNEIRYAKEEEPERVASLEGRMSRYSAAAFGQKSLFDIYFLLING